MSNLEINFLAFIRQHKSIGYGRMLQIITRQWYRDTGDAPIAHTWVSELPPAEQALEAEAALHTDPVFHTPVRPRCGYGDPASQRQALAYLERPYPADVLTARLPVSTGEPKEI